MASTEVPAGYRGLVVGNWKMNGNRISSAELIATLKAAGPFEAEVAVCVPSVYLADVSASLRGEAISWGAQDCSAHESGAFTGEVSAAMLADFDCRYVIVGHSERRALHAESDQLVAAKAKAALGHGITPIVCVGETLAEREAGHTDEVLGRQLSAAIHLVAAQCTPRIVVAYEPIWAIGTGLTAAPAQAQAVHAMLRARLAAATGRASATKILYGGSVKADNAAALFAQPDVDGGLIGGASLKAADFAAICRAAG